ncbi:MAG: hypothetical protein JNK26_02975 [Candidatus Doudnabacteria bacterium]|nr:hypothetical protein [Candidatus Doudnabacteria bacterium]
MKLSIFDDKPKTQLEQSYPQIAHIGRVCFLEDEYDDEAIRVFLGYIKVMPSDVDSGVLIHEIERVLEDEDSSLPAAVTFYLLNRGDKGEEYARNYLRDIINKLIESQLPKRTSALHRALNIFR